MSSAADGEAVDDIAYKQQKSGHVKNVADKIRINEDYGMASKLQDSEFDTHYSRNRAERSQMRGDIGTSKEQQAMEDKYSMELRLQKQVDMEGRDARAAAELQREIEADERRETEESERLAHRLQSLEDARGNAQSSRSNPTTDDDELMARRLHNELNLGLPPVTGDPMSREEIKKIHEREIKLLHMQMKADKMESRRHQKFPGDGKSRRGALNYLHSSKEADAADKMSTARKQSIQELVNQFNTSVSSVSSENPAAQSLPTRKIGMIAASLSDRLVLSTVNENDAHATTQHGHAAQATTHHMPSLAELENSSAFMSANNTLNESVAHMRRSPDTELNAGFEAPQSIDAEQQLNCALDLMRRLPPQQCEKNLAQLLDLVPHLCEELLSSVDVPLKIAKCKQTNKDYLLYDYNRDGDSYRSPWSSKYDPPLDDEGVQPSAKCRKLEQELNAAFESYRDMYFEGGLSSCYVWDTDHGFAVCVLIKKAGDEASAIKGCWDSVHVIDVQEKSNSRLMPKYKLTTTVSLWLQTTKENSGLMNVGGHIIRQQENELPVNENNTHLANMGRMIEEVESKIRASMNEIYFAKTQQVVFELRSTGNASDKAQQARVMTQLKEALTKGQ